MVLGTRQKKRQRRDLHKALVAQGSGVNLFLVSTPCRTFFLGEDTETFSFLSKFGALSRLSEADYLRRQLSRLVLRQRLRAARILSAQLAEPISVKYIGSRLRRVKRCRRKSFSKL